MIGDWSALSNSICSVEPSFKSFDEKFKKIYKYNNKLDMVYQFIINIAKKDVLSFFQKMFSILVALSLISLINAGDIPIQDCGKYLLA